MIRLKQKIIAASAALVMMFSIPAVPKAAAVSPESIRIGINYQSTALTNFNINADKGLQIVYCKDNNITSLYEEPGSNPLIIRKDGYFSFKDGIYSEFNPADQISVTGEKIGPVHVKIGNNYNDYASVINQIAQLKLKAVAAYPVYSDGWQVWTGFYLSEADASADITNNIVKKLGTGTYTVVPASASRISINKLSGEVAVIFDSALGALRVQPKKENVPATFRLNGKSKFRGELEVRRFTGSDMTLINILPFEQYLYGVVPSEMEPYSGPEALKAQAVASRTYALNSLGKHKDNGFDLCSTTHCHVYKGLDSEVPSTNKAVDDTKGKLVMYNGKPAYVYYFASSGGWTENSENVWYSALPYLRSVEDKYELTTSSHYSWQKTFTPSAISSVLLKKGIDVGNVLGVNVKKYTESGRVMELEILGSKKNHLLTKEATRTTFGLNSQMYKVTSSSGVSVKAGSGTAVTSLAGKSILSASGLKTSASSGNITIMGVSGTTTISMGSEGYTFTGKGWGHGVGMSQEGAKGMANAGFTYDAILKHYFTGTTIE